MKTGICVSALTALLAAVCGCSHPDTSAGVAPRPFRVATFNMRTDCDKGEHAWTNRAPLVVKVIEDNGFDIIGAQELKTDLAACVFVFAV